MEPTNKIEQEDALKNDTLGAEEEIPLTLEKRLYQAAEFCYGASKIIEGIEGLEDTSEVLLSNSETLLNFLEDGMVNVTSDELDSIIEEIKG